MELHLEFAAPPPLPNLHAHLPHSGTDYSFYSCLAKIKESLDLLELNMYLLVANSRTSPDGFRTVRPTVWIPDYRFILVCSYLRRYVIFVNIYFHTLKKGSCNYEIDLNNKMYYTGKKILVLIAKYLFP